METNAGRNEAESAAFRCSFLGWTLDTRRQLLLRGNEATRLRPRTYEVLLYLVRNAGRLISKQELMDVVWKDVAVTDDSLVQCLMEIRRALGDAEHAIETVRGRGYLFGTDVRWIADEAVGSHPTEPTASSGPTPQLRVGEPASAQQSIGFSRALVFASAMLLMGIGVIWTSRSRDGGSPGLPIQALAVLPFDNL